MNSTIMAERTAKALEAIREQTERLGGQLMLPTTRFPNPAVKHTLTLEAIAEALTSIGTLPAGAEVEAAIAAVAEDSGIVETERAPAVSFQLPAAKGKRGKE